MGAGGGGSQRVAQAWHGRNTPQRYGRSIADGYTGSTDGEAAFIRDRDLIGAPPGAHPRHGGWGRLGKAKWAMVGDKWSTTMEKKTSGLSKQSMVGALGTAKTDREVRTKASDRFGSAPETILEKEAQII